MILMMNNITVPASQSTHGFICHVARHDHPLLCPALIVSGPLGLERLWSEEKGKETFARVETDDQLVLQ